MKVQNLPLSFPEFKIKINSHKTVTSFQTKMNKLKMYNLCLPAKLISVDCLMQSINKKISYFQ